MCYYLHGAVNRDIHPRDYERIATDACYTFLPGTKHDIKAALANDLNTFRVTNWHCDCDFPAGNKNPSAPELRALAETMASFRSARDIKCIYLCRAWIGTRSYKELTFHIDDVSLPDFLAEMEANCLYRIDLFPRAF